VDEVKIVGFSFLIIILLGLVFIPQFMALANINFSVSDTHRGSYRLAAALENIYALDASEEQLENHQDANKYTYNRRRAVIPVEYFTKEYDSDTGIGYSTKNGHCYLPEVSGLDGENIGVYVLTSKDVDIGEGTGGDYQDIPSDCNPEGETQLLDGAWVSGPALLVREARENPPLPVEVFVYEIKS